MTSPARLRISDSGELVQLVPYLLGFRPADSLVLVCLREGRVACTARVDLERIVDVEQIDALLQRFRASTRLDAVAALVYSHSDAQAGHVMMLLESVSDDVDIVDEVWVHENRWESFAWGCDGVCAADGHVAAEAVYAGLAAAPDRAAVVAVLEPRPDAAEAARAERAAVAARVRRWGRPRRQRELLAALRTAPTEVTPSVAALTAELARDGNVRDAVLRVVTQETAPELLAFWLAVVRVLPDDEYVVAPLGFVALSAWLAGQGTLMAGALERGERIGIDGGLLSLLAQVNELALPPEWWTRASAELAA